MTNEITILSLSSCLIAFIILAVLHYGNIIILPLWLVWLPFIIWLIPIFILLFIVIIFIIGKSKI